MDNRYQEICRQICEAEKDAAGLILHAHGILAETKTGRRDVVTEYDRLVQERLIALLQKACPEAHFIGEESGVRDRLDADRLFIIDPIDGTMNFVHGFHHSCISVAYAERGEVCAAAVYNPYVDELFSAFLGGGAFLNGRKIQVSDAPLEDSVAVFGTAPYYSELEEATFTLARKVFHHCLDLRREGSAALDLCTVAAGRAGVYFEQRVCLWDYAAGALIVREAGGVCSRIDGSPFPQDGSKTDIFAGSQAAAADFRKLLDV